MNGGRVCVEDGSWVGGRWEGVEDGGEMVLIGGKERGPWRF